MPADADGVVWIIGCGDIGCRIGLRLHAAGVTTVGFARSGARRAQIRRLGLDAEALDLDADVPVFETTPDTLIYCAPPTGEGVQDLRLRRLVAALPVSPRRWVYLSTSGVYGDSGGDWVDEDTPPAPRHDRARRRLDAESTIESSVSPGGAVILRVPGIYGPGRLPESRLRSGRPVPFAHDSPYSNRVHADDLADLAIRAAAVPLSSGEVRRYNAADGHPTTMTDYLQRCAALLGLTALPEADIDTVQREGSAMLREFLGESRRLDNRRACAELGWRPRRLDDPRGLASALADDAVVSATAPG